MTAREAILTESEWNSRREAHRQRVRPWTSDRVHRSQRAVKHPVFDFLFEYYSFRPAHLERWSPGLGIACQGTPPSDWSMVSTSAEGWFVDSAKFPVRWRTWLDWGHDFLRQTLAREPQFGCFGLHEWAMVYRSDTVRHGQYPLRLGHRGSDLVVDSLPIRCTHFDAFRFFTPEAIPKNRIALTRTNQIDSDQPGCLHANMDLYKLAYRLGPYIPAELIADGFELAAAAREVDMRASPYDLRTLGFAPICIETREGRDEYALEQRKIAEWARPIRERLAEEYQRILEAVAPPGEILSMKSKPGEVNHPNGSLGLNLS